MQEVDQKLNELDLKRRSRYSEYLQRFNMYTEQEFKFFLTFNTGLIALMGFLKSVLNFSFSNEFILCLALQFTLGCLIAFLLVKFEKASASYQWFADDAYENWSINKSTKNTKKMYDTRNKNSLFSFLSSYCINSFIFFFFILFLLNLYTFIKSF